MALVPFFQFKSAPVLRQFSRKGATIITSKGYNCSKNVCHSGRTGGFLRFHWQRQEAKPISGEIHGNLQWPSNSAGNMWPSFISKFCCCIFLEITGICRLLFDSSLLRSPLAIAPPPPFLFKIAHFGATPDLFKLVSEGFLLINFIIRNFWLMNFLRTWGLLVFSPIFPFRIILVYTCFVQISRTGFITKLRCSTNHYGSLLFQYIKTNWHIDRLPFLGTTTLPPTYFLYVNYNLQLVMHQKLSPRSSPGTLSDCLN